MNLILIDITGIFPQKWRKNDYIDIKMKNKMTQIDPCFTELKKFGLNRTDVEKLILNLKNEVIKQGLNLIKK